MVHTYEDAPEGHGGFDFYPERRPPTGPSIGKLVNAIFSKNPVIERVKCEGAVQKTLEKSLLVKTMLFALRQAGCDVDVRRHISCETCHPAVTGGYDVEMNQIVVCQNFSHSQGVMQSNLAHELIHMFDYCRAKLDFKNPDHVACSEVRAANLLHCSWMTAFLQGETSPLNFGATHQNCVRNKAVNSVMATTALSREEAQAAVDKVFPICYNDLEPLGRRLRRKSDDIEMSYRERYTYAAF